LQARQRESGRLDQDVMVGAAVGEGKMMDKESIDRWRHRMCQFHHETQEGLGGFAAAIVRSEDMLSLAQSTDREAIAFANAAVRWGAMIESGTWQLCLACEYEFRAAKFARAFVFMLPICEKPTLAMLVGVCEECSKKDDGELLEIAYQGCRQNWPSKEQDGCWQSLREYTSGSS
jgi:hypothetical protein